MRPLTFGVVTDEVDQDFDRACHVAHELGMGVVELNNLWGKPAEQLEPNEVRRVREIVQRYDLRLDVIGTLALKGLELSKNPILDHSEEFADHLDSIRNAARVAQALADVSLEPGVRIFSFRREEMVGLGNPSPILPDGGGLSEITLNRIVEGLNKACDVARAEGVRLLVENVRSCWGNTGLNTTRILDATNRPELRIIWDVANDWVSCGKTYQEGYLATKPYTVCVHFKDAKLIDPGTGLTAWTPIGQGAVDVDSQVVDLLRNGFDGPVLLETHWRGEGLSKEESSRRSFAGLKSAVERAQELLRKPA